MLIARNLGPAELLEYDRRRLRAVVLEEGSLTAHVTIVARAMGVPVIGRVHDIRHIANEGDTIVVDGDQGSLVVRPTGQTAAAFGEALNGAPVPGRTAGPRRALTPWVLAAPVLLALGWIAFRGRPAAPASAGPVRFNAELDSAVAPTFTP